LLGNGLSLSETWTDGRLASKRLYNTSTSANLSSLAYAYDNDDNVGSIRDLLNDANSVYYGYDASSRLAFAAMTVGTPATSTDTYNYTSGKNRLASVVNASGTRSISYDNRGNTLSESRPGERQRQRELRHLRPPADLQPHRVGSADQRL
jgi:YD repeat-containing protein